MSVVAELAIFPLDKGVHVARFVSRAVEVIEKSGLAWQLGPMGTSIEGDWGEVMKVVDSCFKVMAADSDRVYLTLKVDYRNDGKQDRLTSKVARVRQNMGQSKA